MAGSLNMVQLIGNLGADPEIRRTQDGRPVASFSIATSESWRDAITGEKKERTEWHRVTVWNEGLCGIVEKYIKKGSKVYVRGQLQTRKWQDQEGVDRYSTEVVLSGFGGDITMLDSANGGGGARDPNDNANRPGNQSGGGRTGNGGYSRDMDDDIPFSPEWR